MEHSIIPCSSAGIWGKPDGCTGWVLMNQMYPETEETPESAEGTASHEIGAGLIVAAAQAQPLAWSAFEGLTASNGVLFTEEMFDGAQEYANDVAAVMRERAVFGGPNLGIEKRVLARQIHELSFGTCDCFLFDRNTGALFIWDYKFGYEKVEAFENWQSINYAAGIIEELGINGLGDQVTDVHIRIAQPRAYRPGGPIQEWVVKASDLRGYWNILKHNASRALGPDAEFKTGPHCKHCPGRHACQAAIQAGMGLFEVATKPIPVELPPAALGVQLAIVKRARKQLEYIESGLDAQVDSLVRGGKLVPGWTTEATFGRQTWRKPVKEVIALGEMFEKDLRKEGAITPKQAIKLGIDEAVITAYSTTPRTGVKVVQDNGNKAKQVFSK